MHCARRATLLELVTEVQQFVASDDEVVALIADMVNSGRVVLRGNFAGYRIALLARR